MLTRPTPGRPATAEDVTRLATELNHVLSHRAGEGFRNEGLRTVLDVDGIGRTLGLRGTIREASPRKLKVGFYRRLFSDPAMIGMGYNPISCPISIDACISWLAGKYPAYLSSGYIDTYVSGRADALPFADGPVPDLSSYDVIVMGPSPAQGATMPPDPAWPEMSCLDHVTGDSHWVYQISPSELLNIKAWLQTPTSFPPRRLIVTGYYDTPREMTYGGRYSDDRTCYLNYILTAMGMQSRFWKIGWNSHTMVAEDGYPDQIGDVVYPDFDPLDPITRDVYRLDHSGYPGADPYAYGICVDEAAVAAAGHSGSILEGCGTTVGGVPCARVPLIAQEGYKQPGLGDVIIFGVQLYTWGTIYMVNPGGQDQVIDFPGDADAPVYGTFKFTLKGPGGALFQSPDINWGSSPTNWAVGPSSTTIATAVQNLITSAGWTPSWTQTPHVSVIFRWPPGVNPGDKAQHYTVIVYATGLPGLGIDVSGLRNASGGTIPPVQIYTRTPGSPLDNALFLYNLLRTPHQVFAQY